MSKVIKAMYVLTLKADDKETKIEASNFFHAIAAAKRVLAESVKQFGSLTIASHRDNGEVAVVYDVDYKVENDFLIMKVSELPPAGVLLSEENRYQSIMENLSRLKLEKQIANDKNYKEHTISVNTNQDGMWIYKISGPLLNEEKSFSTISSGNSTVDKWKKELDTHTVSEAKQIAKIPAPKKEIKPKKEKKAKETVIPTVKQIAAFLAAQNKSESK